MSDTVIVIQESVETVAVNSTASTIEIANPGVPGPTGPAGADGTDGVGVPAGGMTGQALVKASDTDYDTTWGAGGGGASAMPDLTDVESGPALTGEAPVWDGAQFTFTDVATQAELGVVVAAAVIDGDAAGGVLAGTYPNPSFASDMATQAELDAHISDSSAAHAASAISVDSTTLSGVGADVQASLEELDNLLDAHHTRHENGGADEISVAGLSGQLADSQPTDATLVNSGPASDGQVLTADGLGGASWNDVGAGSTPALVDLTDVTGSPPNTGEAPVWDGDSFELTDVATQSELDAVAAAKQNLDSDLTAIAALTPTNDDVIQRKAGSWTNRTMAQVIADLAALGTTFQPLDSDLTAIAALSTTSFGRGLLALADPAALRTSAGLVIGTDIPSLPTFNDHSARHEDGGADEISLTGLSGVGADMVSRTSGGLETVSTVSGTGATETLDLANGNVHDITLDANCTLTLTGATNGKGCSLQLIIRQDATGGRTLIWPGSVVWIGGTAPVLQVAGNAVDLVSLFTVDGGTTWYGTFGTPLRAIGCKATRSSNQTISTATWTPIDMTTEVWDTGALHDNVTNPSRITVPVAGKYVVCGSYMMTGSSSGTRYIAFAVNGSRSYQAPMYPVSTGTMTRELSDILNLAADDYVELHCYQDSGSNRTLSSAYLSVAFMGT